MKNMKNMKNIKIPTESFIPLGILGILLLYSYYYYTTQNTTNITKLWGLLDKKHTLKSFYYVSMLLSAVCFLIVLYYLHITRSIENQHEILMCLYGIVAVSLFWMPLSLAYLKNKTKVLHFAILSVLSIIALCSLNVVKLLYEMDEKRYTIMNQIALASMIYFFFHVFLLDTLTWSFHFF